MLNGTANMKQAKCILFRFLSLYRERNPTRPATTANFSGNQPRNTDRPHYAGHVLCVYIRMQFITSIYGIQRASVYCTITVCISASRVWRLLLWERCYGNDRRERGCNATWSFCYVATAGVYSKQYLNLHWKLNQVGYRASFFTWRSILCGICSCCCYSRLRS